MQTVGKKILKKKNNKHTHTQNHALRFSKAVFFPRKPHMLAASHVLPELLGDPTLLSVSSAPAHNPRSPKTPKEENPSPCASLPETSTQEQRFPKEKAVLCHQMGGSC